MTAHPAGPATSPADPSPAPRLPRELVLASAGSGKTFRISSRIIGLLEAGEDPDRILASTFARKAAGEILNRVLERLARAAVDDEAADDLAGHALLPGRPAPDPSRWLALLRDLVRRLHRAGVGTLDAFFVRTARSFATELGLRPGWRIADEPTARRLETEALQDVLERADRGEIVELVRALMRGRASRGVQDRLLGQARELREILHELAPAAQDPWAPFSGPWSPAGRDEDAARDGEDRTGEGGDRFADDDPDEVADAIAALEPPANQDGSPDARWEKAVDRAARAVRLRDWRALTGAGIGRKIVEGEVEYCSRPIGPDVVRAFDRALLLARRDLAARYHRQCSAMGRLARDFDEALARRQRDEGAYRFSDVTRLLGGPDPLTTRPDLWYRLDRRARHLLLDEFQDTSVSQWLALRPLATELLSGHRGERSAVVVADPKQSIYGWRGAEPGLVERLGTRFGLERTAMHRSWRSSREVLEFVNLVFEDLPSNPVWGGDERDRRIAGRWAAYFEPHAPAEEREDLRPGHVRVLAGPRDGSPMTKARPAMARRAADLVARLHADAPGATIGVLTRHNEAVARIIAELRRRGVEASEEGGTRLTDAPAVVAVLALLRAADHPGHVVARYHVAGSPLGRVVGLEDHTDDGAARRVSADVRRALLRDGYGATVNRWTRALVDAGALERRGLRRMLQLVELGFRWDERDTLRPGDFVRFVESERVEDPLAACVRVMTVHRSKGLEFDAVVLPELDTPLTGLGGGGPALLPERDPETSRIRRAFPYVPKRLRPLFPEVDGAWEQHRASQLRDALGVLYVGLTRARHALHVLVAADDPDAGLSSACTYARLVREALGRHDDPVSDGDVLHERGDPAWFERADRAGAAAAGGRGAEAPVVRLAERPRSRALPHRTPSELAGGSRVEPAAVLDLSEGGAEARRRGGLVHDWCRTVGWIEEDGLPTDGELRARARRLDPAVDPEELDELLASFRTWLDAPEVRAALTRAGSAGALGIGGDDVPGEGDGGRLRLHRELPFAVRLDGEILRGTIDRLVLAVERAAGGDERPVAARVLDFKTDAVDPGSAAALDRRVRHHRPQLQAYRKAVARQFGLDASRVGAALVFLEGGVLREV